VSNKGIAWPGGEPQSVRDTYDRKQDATKNGDDRQAEAEAG
jgi:hypothetical protein